MGKLILLCISLLLFGCEERTKITDGKTVIMLADQQRHAAMATARAASYIVYPDMPDPSIMTDEGFFKAIRNEQSLGTAFGVSEKGLVVTAAHVVTHNDFCTAEDHPDGVLRKEKKKETYCSLVTQTYKKVFRAKVLLIDEVNDVVVMQIEDLREALPFLKLAENGSFDDGEEVLTIGIPRGNPNYTTFGFISNLDFFKPNNDDPRKIQFHAAIQPGNSGGALIGVKSGEVVGVVTEVFVIYTVTPGGIVPTSTGMSYATPAETLKIILKKCTP